MKAAFARHLTAERATILRNSGYLVATTVATAGFGFVFWWIAARHSSAHEVGLAAAAVSAMMLLGYLSMLGFGTLLIAEIHERRERAIAYVVTATTVGGLAGVGLGLVAVALAPLVSRDLASFAQGGGAGVLFVIGVGLTSASLVADQALIGLLRGGTQFIRNAVFAATKLLMLFIVAVLVATVTSVSIFATWVSGLAVSMLLLVVLAIRADGRPRAYRPDLQILHHLGRGILKHHTLNMAMQAPSLARPVIVASALSPSAAAYFYSASMIAGFVSVATPALGITLFAVAARSPSALAHSIRLTLVVSFLFSAVGTVGAILLGRAVLSTFGAAYADEATVALIVLTIAALPGVIKTHFIQLGRIRRRVGWTAVFVSLGAVVELGGAALGAIRGGLVGLSIGYAIAITLEGLIMTPTVLRAGELWPRSGAGLGEVEPAKTLSLAKSNGSEAWSGRSARPSGPRDGQRVAQTGGGIRER